MGSQNKQRVGRFGKTVQSTNTICDMKVGEIFYIYKNNLLFTPKGVFLSLKTKFIKPTAIDRLFPDLEDLLIACVPIERIDIGFTEADFIIDFSEIEYNQLCIKDDFDYQSLIEHPEYIIFYGFHAYEESDHEIKFDIDEYTVSVKIENNPTDFLPKVSLEELKIDLEKAINEEDYLNAALIRDKMKNFT